MGQKWSDPIEWEVEMKINMIIVVLLIFPVADLSAMVWYVDDDNTSGPWLGSPDYPFQYIQDAIKPGSTQNGDLILVRPGMYIENINFLGKDIEVRSDADGDPATLDTALDDTIIDGNQTGRTVTFYPGSTRDAVLEGFSITNGNGGILCSTASPRILNNKIFNNTAVSQSGGGIYSSMASPLIMNNLIQGNKTDNGHGAGIYQDKCDSAFPPEIIDNHIIENETIGSSSKLYGGGIYCYNCRQADDPLIIRNNLIEKNHAKYRGGGIRCTYSDPIIESNVIIENTSDYTGGGIFFSSDYGTIMKSNTICYNEADYGGGIQVYQTHGPTISDTMIFRNYAWMRGGGFYINSCSPKIVNCTICNNNAPVQGYGGGIYLTKAHPTIVNSILWYNYASNGGNQIYKSSSSPNVTYSNIQDGWPGEGNIDEEPMFVDWENDDYHIQYPSPCRNTGITSEAIGPIDFEGDSRFWDYQVDMGADEFYNHIYCWSDNYYCHGKYYPHYWMDGFGRGEEVEIRLIGEPGSWPTGLIIGTAVLEEPVPLPYGDFYLAGWAYWPLETMPANGVQSLPVTIPAASPVPKDYPMQGLVGTQSDSLTNLYVLQVRNP